MKQERFEKVVKGDKDELISTWVNGLISLFFPFLLLSITKVSFSIIVFIAFIDGIFFILFVDSILDYIRSRKVYWRKIK